ncbi:DUF6883 domain-containing protein [Pseudomonas sp. FP2338]|uniref:DUF6883 domain-containing protein n=1 Tax=Pseudomonas sp. FP2338 TaxID=2954093 RepID=UPI00351E97F2
MRSDHYSSNPYFSTQLYPAKLGAADKFGQRITIDMPMTGPNGNTATVRTGWIFDPGSSTPNMTTLYVKSTKRGLTPIFLAWQHLRRME